MKSYLKSLRLRKNLTQTEISDMLGISQSAYYQYESGKQKVPYNTAMKISEILSVDINDIFLPATFTICHN